MVWVYEHSIYSKLDFWFARTYGSEMLQAFPAYLFRTDPVLSGFLFSHIYHNL